jgi:Bacterial protein of unknown function (DUF937)
MPGLLESLFGHDTQTVDDLRAHTGDDRNKAEQAYTAAAGTILRGLETKSQTEEGAKSVWDMLRKQVEQGNIPADAPSQGGVKVRDMDPKVATDMMKVIFGKDAPDVQQGYAKVITLDPATAQKVFAKVLPAVLGGIFGAAENHPDDSRKALPQVVGNARSEMERQQPKAAGVFDAILDVDHDGDVDLQDLAGFFARRPK